MLFAAWSVVSSAASLDLLEVGGAYGTPAATNPSALWWNPAGLAVRGGTQFLVEGAPTFGGLNVDRDNPDYGTLNPVDGFPSSYDYSGSERFSSLGVVPFVGVSSDLGVKGLGLGLGLYVPAAKSAKTDQEWGPNRFASREGSIRAAHLSLGASYRIADKVALGASGSVVDSSWYGKTDSSALPDLAWTVVDQASLDSLPEWYQDGLIESQDYTTTLVLGGQDEDGGHGSLHDRTFTFGGGVYVTPNDRLGISVAWNQGVKLTHEGDVTFLFQCPPEADIYGFAASEDGGTCNTTVPGTVELDYQLPSRLHLGVAFLPTEQVRLEVMGAWVGWHVLDRFDIRPLVSASDVPANDNITGSISAALMSQERYLARGARDSFWVGVDGKVAVDEAVTVGGRVTFDRAAIPTEYVTASNIDADTVLLEAMGQVRPVERLGIGLSYTYAASGARTVTDSVFSQSIASADPSSPNYYLADEAANATYYSSANGRYALGIHRIGLSLQGQFGGTTTGL